MGSWGITAFESDLGLDSINFIRKNLLNNGKLELKEIIEALYKDEWCKPYDVTYGENHTSLMALAELILKFVDKDIDDLDYDDEWAKNDNKFSDLISFTASKESIKYIRNYISDTLKYAKEYAENAKSTEDTMYIQDNMEWKWNGWFEEEDWINWQKHMSALINRLDVLINTSEDYINLLPEQEQKHDFTIEPKL